MKFVKISCIVLVFFVFFVGCNEKKAIEKNIINNNYILYSLPWGESWENIKDNKEMEKTSVMEQFGDVPLSVQSIICTIYIAYGFFICYNKIENQYK